MSKTFKGILFKTDLSDGKTSVDVQLTRSAILLNYDGSFAEWSPSEMRVTTGGSNNHLIFFIRKDQPDLSFYLPLDRDLKLVLKELSIGHWEQDLKKAFTEHKQAKFIWGGLALAAVLGIILVIAFRSEISKGLVQAIPFQIEEVIGEKLISAVLPPHSRVHDEELLKHLGESLEPLRQVLPDKYRGFRFYISSSPEINAFALPGGHIVFNMGALKVAKSGSELLGVAAHELAHVTERHVMRNLLQGVGTFVVLQAFWGDFTGLIAVIADQGVFLLNQSFSRAMETEADTKAFDYLTDAKIDPRGMAKFFQHILDQSHILGDAGKKIEKPIEFLSTHPDTQSRIDDINSKYSALDEETRKRFSTDLESFKLLKQKLEIQR